MSKSSTIHRRSIFYYAQAHFDLCLLTFFLFMLFVPFFENIYIGTISLNNFYSDAFIPVELIVQMFFIYHMEYPKTFVFGGNKYKRIPACIEGHSLEKWSPIESLAYPVRLFLYAFGIRRTIIIAKCKETDDVKVQCPYCKSIIEVEDVKENCPVCHKKMHDGIVSLTIL